MRAMAAASAAAAVLTALVPARSALAWGASGHRMIGVAAAEALPPDLPPFLHAKQAIADLGELAREPDRWKDAGKTHDTTRDPAHFVDVDDEGRVQGGPKLNALPATRSEFDAQLRAVGTDSWHTGYLPYAIVDGYQQLVLDFAYWRVLTAAIPRERDRTRRAWEEQDLARRESLILTDLGEWSHYVGDGSQPLHVSVHYNGWGNYPNPHGYTQDKVHVPWEGPFVREFVSLRAVKAAMTPIRPCRDIGACTTEYLSQTASTAILFYEMQKAGGLDGAHPSGVPFTVARIAAGASELRDLTVAAWNASAHGQIGYPAISVESVVNGGVDPYDALYADD